MVIEMDLIREILKGSPKAIAYAISQVENESHDVSSLMKEIFPYTGNSVIVGVTGASGSGKSTLLNQLIGLLREEGKKIGVIAVDPTSPFSGGAILGDRIRMMRHSSDPEIFVRSMATRGQLGGLARATGEAISILEAAGKEYVLVETIGAGQDEVEIVRWVDVVVVVLSPGTGDDIQAFKAGIMEIADILVINKADSPEFEQTKQHIQAMLSLQIEGERTPPIIDVIATSGEGIECLLREIDAFIQSINPSERESRKKMWISQKLKDIIGEKIYGKLSDVVSESEFERLVDKIFKHETDPYSVADGIVDRLKES